MKKIFALVLFLLTCNAQANNAYVHKMTQNGALSCLTNTVFYESNLESKKDKELVAVVVLNRAVTNNKHVCDVVKRKAQFSFYKTGMNWNERATHEESLKIVLDILRRSMQNRQNTYNNVMFFHANTIKPSWNYKELVVVSKQSGHTFYRMKEMKK